jgi:hypothetical protein
MSSAQSFLNPKANFNTSSSICGTWTPRESPVDSRSSCPSQRSAVTSSCWTTACYVWKYAFYGSSLRSILIPKSVETMGLLCFYDCKSLREVTFEGRLKTGWDIFEGCLLFAVRVPFGTGLSRFHLPKDCWIEYFWPVVPRPWVHIYLRLDFSFWSETQG